MKFYLLFILALCCILVSCSSDKSNTAIKNALEHFSINGKDLTAYKMTNKDQFDVSNNSNYITVGLNEDISISLDLPKGVNTDITWFVNGSELKGNPAKTKFPETGPYEIVLQVPGFEEVVKFVVVNEQGSVEALTDQVTVAEDAIPVEDPSPAIENSAKEIPVKKQETVKERPVSPVKNTIVVKEKNNVQKGKTEKSKTQSRDITQPEIVDGPPPPPKRVNPEPVPEKAIPAKTETATDFSKSKTEGASRAEPCKTATYTATASATLKPTQSVELSSFYVYTAQSGNVDIILLENGKQLEKLAGRHVNSGMTQIRVSTLNSTLKAGKSYELKVVGSGGITFANLSPCGAGGGGSILNPSYPVGVTIFNIHFNY